MLHSALWRETLKNLLLSTLLYSGLLLALWLVQLAFPSLHLLHFDDAAWCIGIPASILGVGYVLTIRNPKNFTGFYPGVVMSLLLGVQFFLQKNYDLVVMSVLICMPCQILSILAWNKSNEQAEQSAKPAFLPRHTQVLTLLLFLLICAIDYLQIIFISRTDMGVGMNIISCIVFSSQILANILLIYKKTDSWIYWIIYSFFGMVFFALIGNIFSVVLYLFFLVINSLAAKQWFKLSR